jgi:hypothetical protein
MLSMVPMSTPRVGWPTSISFGLADTSRAMTTFCWLPPESRPMRRSGFGRAHVEGLEQVARSGGDGLEVEQAPAVLHPVLVAEYGVLHHREILDHAVAQAVFGHVADAQLAEGGRQAVGVVRPAKGSALPRKSTLPEVGRRMPDRISISSLWPLPDTPAMATISPARSSKPMSARGARRPRRSAAAARP